MAALRTPGSLALAAAAALALILIVPGPARGCKCAHNALSEYADEVAVAFSGRQIERIDHLNDSGAHFGSTLVLKVHQVYRGQAGPLIEVRTGNGFGDCGTDFLRKGGGIGAAFGKDVDDLSARLADGSVRADGVTGVAAFGYGEDTDQLSVGICGSHVSISELEEVFGPGRPPDETVTLPENTDEAATITDSAAASPRVTAARPQTTDEAATAAAAPPEEGGGIPGATAVLITAAAVLLAGGAAAMLRRRGRPDGE